MNLRISLKLQRSCFQKITWHTSCPDLSAQTYPMHPVCFLWTLRIAAGQKKCLISAESQKSMLPKLYESYEVVGTLKEDIAKELGLPAEVKVIAGAGDNAAAAVGTGTVGDGRCNISLGTSGTIFISSKNFGVDEHNALTFFCTRRRILSSDGMYVKCSFLQQVVE